MAAAATLGCRQGLWKLPHSWAIARLQQISSRFAKGWTEGRLGDSRLGVSTLARLLLEILQCLTSYRDHVTELILRFVESFGVFVSTLSDDEFLTIYKFDKKDQSPKLQALLQILRRLGRAIETNSKDALKVSTIINSFSD